MPIISRQRENSTPGSWLPETTDWARSLLCFTQVDYSLGPARAPIFLGPSPMYVPSWRLQTPFLYQIHESTGFTKRGTNISVNIRTPSTGRNVGRIPTDTKCTPQSGVVVQKITPRSHCFNEGNIFLALISFPL